jgi:hypothetical protein
MNDPSQSRCNNQNHDRSKEEEEIDGIVREQKNKKSKKTDEY